MSLFVKGVSSFLGLADAPHSYSGQSKKVARVNTGENALEFGGPPLGFVNFYNGAAPTDFPWNFETAAPWTYVTGPFFSPIIKNAINQMEVYVIDFGTNFWKYNIDTKHWTKLASPNYTGTGCSRQLAFSPDGAKLACTSEQYPGADGGRRISIYTIATDTWTDSSQCPQIAGNDAYVRSLVWQDNNTIWAWAKRAQVNHTFQCKKYTPSTDTWTSFANTFLSGYATGTPAAIKADGSVVFGGGIGAAIQNYCKYTVATDTYDAAGTIGAGRQPITAAAWERNRLWFASSSTWQPGYLNVETEVATGGVFPVNPERTIAGTYGFYLTTAAIMQAKGTEPSLMTYIGTGTWRLAQQALSQRALVLVDKPDDGYAVLATEPTLLRTIPFYAYSSVTVPAGTWSFYYPKSGDYTKIKLYYSLLEGG